MEEKNDNIELKIKKITNRVLIGLDIGGTLTKLCFIISNTEKEIENLLSSKKNFKRVEIDSYQLYLYHFQTINYKKDILPILNDINQIVKIETIDATGGGAYKYCDIMKNDFGIEFIKHDELRSLIYGYEFMNKYNSFYEIDKGISKPISSSELTFPHISANIGSGVSFLKVTSPFKYERVGGTLMGGGTLIGVSKLILGIDNYDEILELANKGNSENVDLTLNDIMGGGGDNENSVISSLGKVPEYAQSGRKDNLRKEDIALSLLNMICSEITQYAFLYAEKNNIDTIYYFGTFTKNDSIINQTLYKTSIHFNKNIKVRFNYFGGYLGTIGSLLEKKN
jgi:type II pantothenate kinase